MKDISSMLVMSREESYAMGCDDVTLGTDYLPTVDVDMSQVETQTLLTDARVSVMDWAEHLIAMTLSASGDVFPTAAPTSARDSRNMNTTMAADLSNSTMAVEVNSTTTNTNMAPSQGRLLTNQLSSLATVQQVTQTSRQEPGFVSPSLVSLIDKDLAKLDSPPVIPTQRVSDGVYHSAVLLSREEPAVGLDSLFTDLLTNSELSCSAQFVPDACLPSADVGFELGKPPTARICCNQPTAAITSLETPVLEACSLLDNVNANNIAYSSASAAADDSRSGPHFPIESQQTDLVCYDMYKIPSSSSGLVGQLLDSYCDVPGTGDLILPGIDIAEVEIASLDTIEELTLQQGQDVDSSQIVVRSAVAANTDSICRDDENSAAVLDSDSPLQFTVFTIEAPEASTTFPSEEFTEANVDSSILEALRSGMMLSSCLDQGFPTEPVLTLMSHDLPVSQTSHDLLPGNTDLGVDMMSTTGSRLLHPTTTELVVTSSSRSRVLEPVTTTPPRVRVQVPTTHGVMYTQTHTDTSEVNTSLKRSRKRCLAEAGREYQSLRDEGDSSFSLNLRVSPQTACKLLNDQRLDIRETSRAHTATIFGRKKAEVLVGNDLNDVCNTSDDCSSTMYTGSTFADVSTSSSTFSSISSSTSSLFAQAEGQSNIQSLTYSPFIHQSHAAATSDALVTPGDMYNPVVLFDCAWSSDAAEKDSTNFQIPTSDISDSSVGDSVTDNLHPAMFVSSTQGASSQGHAPADRVKDSLRSKLKAKRQNVNLSCQMRSLAAEGNRKPPECDVSMWPAAGTERTFACVDTNLSGPSVGSSLMIARSSPGHSPLSNTFQSGSTDDDDNDEDTMSNDDEETDDTLSVQPVQKKWKDDKDREKAEESEESRLAKREKNRLAAQKCRTRRRDKIDSLTQQVQKLEEKQERIKTEVERLEVEREQLQEMLRLHSFICKRKL